MRRIGGRNATRVAGDPGRHESAPAFAPDGRTIAFHEADADGGIFIVGATGESERRISDAGFHPAWSPDGRSVFTLNDRSPQPGTVLPAILIEGGVFRIYSITSDGTRLAGLATSPEGARMGVGWHDLGTGDTWVSRETADVGLPAWLDDEHLVFPITSRSMGMIDRSKRRQVVGGPFPFEISQLVPPAVARDGRTIFVGATVIDADVWMVERGR